MMKSMGRGLFLAGSAKSEAAWVHGLEPVLPSAAASAERRQSKLRRDFLALRPVVVGVALEAALFPVPRPGRMARLASPNPRPSRHIVRTQSLPTPPKSALR